jgi:hypothetical protein
MKMPAAWLVIEVNIPYTEAMYRSGHGERVWLEVDRETAKAYDNDETGVGYFGIMRNNSRYFPELRFLDVVPFEMRGRSSPVVEWSFLKDKQPLPYAEYAALLKRVGGSGEYIRHNIPADD